LNIDLLDKYLNIRIIGLIIYSVFSWLQVWAYRSLGKSYSQDIVVLKEHKLITGKMYKYIRHPQYISQCLSDLGAGVALFSFLVVPLVLFVELPLFVLRAIEEEKILKKHFNEEYSNYKKKSGFMLPFIG